jgi:protein TonB
MKNVKTASAKNALLRIAMALLVGGSTLLAQVPPDKTADAVYEVGHGVTAPKPIYTPDPQFADCERVSKVQGTVELAMIVTAKGKVRDVKVTKSLDQCCDRKAEAAVSTWRFKPAAKDGGPVAVHISAQVEFKMQ